MYKLYKHVHVDVHVLHGRLIHPMYKLYKHVHVDVHVLHGRLIHPMYKLYKHVHVVYMYYMEDSSTQCISCIYRACAYTKYCGRQKHWTAATGFHTPILSVKIRYPPPPSKKPSFTINTKCGISISQRYFNWHKSFTTPFSNFLLGAFFSRGERELPILTCGGSITSAAEPVGAYVEFFSPESFRVFDFRTGSLSQINKTTHIFVNYWRKIPTFPF